MAYPPSVLPPRRGQQYQWNEKYYESNIQAPQQIRMKGPQALTDSYESKSSNRDRNSISIKSNSSNENKCQVYVHQLSKTSNKTPRNCNNWRGGSEIHQHTYKHEISDYYDTELNHLKRQFDNLGIQPRKPRSGISQNYSSNNQGHKTSYIKPGLASKLKNSILFKNEHKAVVDKLEESYWAKWKPSKIPIVKEAYPKMKSLYTGNEKYHSPYKLVHHKNGRNERGDSHEAIVPPNYMEECEEQPINTLMYISSPEHNIEEQEQEKGEIKNGDDAYIENQLVPLHNYRDIQQKQDVDDNPETSAIKRKDSEYEIGNLKHTDSFILTVKKQSLEKPHFQQPKCIKLFKNAGYSASTVTTYNKGGSYPLKSCLKRDNSSMKSTHLGRPGSPIRGFTLRRPGKCNRYTK